MKYEVWQFYQLILTGDFDTIKAWMLNHYAFERYRDDIIPATEDNFDDSSMQDLRWIATLTEYCAIKRVA